MIDNVILVFKVYSPINLFTDIVTYIRGHPWARIGSDFRM